MKKFALALALVTGLAVTRADADTITTLGTSDMSAQTFNSLFTPDNAAVLSPFQFDGASSNSGMIESQVFKGVSGSAADGLYAYAYQVAVNPDAGTDPAHVDSLSFKFNANSLGTNLTGSTAYGYIIQNGQVGTLDLSGTQTPTSLSFQPGTSTGYIRAQYVDAGSNTPPINAGSNSATFVLLSNQAPAAAMSSVNVGGPAATTTLQKVFVPASGTIEPTPVPEPATALAWAGVLGGTALFGRARRSRANV